MARGRISAAIFMGCCAFVAFGIGTSTAKPTKPAKPPAASAAAPAQTTLPAAPAPTQAEDEHRATLRYTWKEVVSPICKHGDTESPKQKQTCAGGETCCIKQWTSPPFVINGVDSGSKPRASSWCANLKADQENCGGCGRECPSGMTCEAGACTCPKGQVVCDGACTDLLRDSDMSGENDNCGACGKKCGGRQLCKKGKCETLKCAAGESFCQSGKYCSNLSTEESDCGKCGHQCPDGWACTAGRCRP